MQFSLAPPIVATKRPTTSKTRTCCSVAPLMTMHLSALYTIMLLLNDAASLMPVSGSKKAVRTVSCVTIKFRGLSVLPSLQRSNRKP